MDGILPGRLFRGRVFRKIQLAKQPETEYNTFNRTGHPDGEEKQ
jgi:hypothetical protein